MLDFTSLSHWAWLLLYSFGLFVIVWVIRKVVEAFVKGAIGNTYWNVAVMVMPVVLGAGLSFVWIFPAAVQGVSEKILIGLCAGFMSTTAYRVVKALVKKETGVDMDAASIPAPPSPEALAAKMPVK